MHIVSCPLTLEQSHRL